MELALVGEYYITLPCLVLFAFGFLALGGGEMKHPQMQQRHAQPLPTNTQSPRLFKQKVTCVKICAAKVFFYDVG